MSASCKRKKTPLKGIFLQLRICQKLFKFFHRLVRGMVTAFFAILVERERFFLSGLPFSDVIIAIIGGHIAK